MIDSSGNEECLGKDTSKQGRIDAIDADEEVILVSVQDEDVSNDVDKEMFDVDVLDGEEVFVAKHEVTVKGVNDDVNVAEEVVEVINTAKLIIDVVQDSVAGDIAKIDVDRQLDERMQRKERRNRADTRDYKKQNVEDDKETMELKQFMEIIPDEEVAIDAIPLYVKSPNIVDWKIYKEG
nr:hypothetical protein [Tanacetum cinerariifolium]